MSGGLSAYTIGGRVWVVATDTTAEPETPRILPMGSVVLTEDEAMRLGAQVYAAAIKAGENEGRRPPRAAA